MIEPELATALAILLMALLLDQFLGEYPSPLHPVVWIGKLTSLLLRCAPQSGWWRPFIFGIALAAGVPALCAAAAAGILCLTADIPVLEVILGAFLLKASFALRELGAAAERVRAPIEAGDLPRAREALRSLCSRDPAQLDAEALVAATVQSLAENLSDSFVAPLFFFALFGVPGAIAYRAINTLDAMVGYRGRFEALGKASARFDDVVNWLPARLTALLLLFAGLLAGRDIRRGWHIFRRDRAKTPSPNGGQPMAMMAGLLGVRLEKQGSYALGDPDHALTPATVRDAWRLTVVAACLAAALIVSCVVAIHGTGIMPRGGPR
jgi:adenosylcobinamide-phosphate synthase